MSIKKSLAALFLIFAVLLPSCAGKGAGTETADTGGAASETAETAAEKITPNLPDTDFGGRAFRIFGRENKTYSQFTNFEFYAESATGDVVNDAVLARNRAIEEKYNITVSQYLTDETTAVLKKLIASAEDSYDVAALHNFANITALAMSGSLIDLNTVGYIDFTKPWWDTDVNASLSFAGKLYYTTSDYLLLDKQRTYILIFNKDMAENYSLGSLYGLADAGKWTAEAMLSMLAAVSSDLDGDGAMTDLDQYGLGMDSYLSFYTFYIAMGGTIAGRDEDDMPTLNMNTERNISVADKVLALTSDTKTSFFCNDFNGKVDYDYWAVMERAFYAGRELFMSAFPHSLKAISSSTGDDFDYGVIPFPKYDEAQEKYLTIPDNYHSMVLTVPVTNADPDFAGFMLEAFSAESKYTTLPAYYEISCKNKYTYDADSARMLDVIFNGITYDIGSIYDWGSLWSLLVTTLPSKKQNVFSSEYAKHEQAAQKALQKTIDEFLEVSG